jgi:hypothetical protein
MWTPAISYCQRDYRYRYQVSTYLAELPKISQNYWPWKNIDPDPIADPDPALDMVSDSDPVLALLHPPGLINCLETKIFSNIGKKKYQYHFSARF